MYIFVLNGPLAVIYCELCNHVYRIESKRHKQGEKIEGNIFCSIGKDISWSKFLSCLQKQRCVVKYILHRDSSSLFLFLIVHFLALFYVEWYSFSYYPTLYGIIWMYSLTFITLCYAYTVPAITWRIIYTVLWYLFFYDT